MQLFTNNKIHTEGLKKYKVFFATVEKFSKPFTKYNIRTGWVLVPNHTIIHKYLYLDSSLMLKINGYALTAKLYNLVATTSKNQSLSFYASQPICFKPVCPTTGKKNSYVPFQCTYLLKS